MLARLCITPRAATLRTHQLMRMWWRWRFRHHVHNKEIFFLSIRNRSSQSPPTLYFCKKILIHVQLSHYVHQTTYHSVITSEYCHAVLAVMHGSMQHDSLLHCGMPITMMARRNLCWRLSIINVDEQMNERAVHNFIAMFKRSCLAHPLWL